MGAALLRQLYTSVVLLSVPILFGCRGAMLPGADASISSRPDSLVQTPLPGQEIAPEMTKQSDGTDNSELQATLVEIVDELTDLGALDEQSKRDLMADLREADPESWPLIVKQFRSALAFRKQIASVKETTTDEELADSHFHQRRRRQARSEYDRLPDEAQQMASTGLHAKRVKPRSLEQEERRPRHLEAAPVDSSYQAHVDASRPTQRRVRHASHNALALSPEGWEGQLQGAIRNLQTAVPADPTSTDEVNEHMRLRLLQLLAGDQEAALQPIPGATAPQQDYWNQQLFAVSTYLDSEGQPDNKRRALGSLTYLDQARSKLAEMATLQVRSLAFVEEVEGYGDYELRESAEFAPGDPVTLYAEIENFSSEATREGHKTRLGTSFEILDGNGKRIESAQFPEVEDVCKTLRRDFHMQYTITLPTRIYPDKYEIRLIVTDERSQKIGRASLPFEIVE